MSAAPPSELLRVAVVGATGSLGSELVAVLEERAFPVSTLVPIATDRSLGREIDFAGESWAVETGVASLEGFDLVFLCAPRDASLEYARLALHAQVPSIDCSGALATQPDVALLVADLLDPEHVIEQPLVASPAGPALAWSLVLRPLAEAAGLRRVVATSFEAASVHGRIGVDALSDQSIALFNQQDPSEDELAEPVAFDCLPAIGAIEEDGASEHERHLAATLARLLGPFGLALTAVRVPTFSGDGAALAVETQRALAAEEARARLAKAPGVRLWPEPGRPSTRTAVGLDEVLVGRVRRDPSAEHGLQLWLAADGLRLAALNAVKLAELRPLQRR